MAREFAESFYKSSKWLKCRDAYIKKRMMIDGGACEECTCRSGYIVHHKILLTTDNVNNPEISLNHDNLKYVCKQCHDLFEDHGVGRAHKPLCVFDEEGQPISMREIDR